MSPVKNGQVPEHETDAEIVQATLADPHRFGSLFERYFDDVHRYLRRRVDSHLADDLAAETFLEAFGVIGRYDLSRPNARPWLFGIATNLVAHHARDERTRLRAYAREAGMAPSSAGEDVDARIDAAACRPQLLEGLAAMEPRDRDALLLFAWADLSYSEIAEALDVPVGTVRSRLHRARRLLRELLDAGASRTEWNTVDSKEA